LTATPQSTVGRAFDLYRRTATSRSAIALVAANAIPLIGVLFFGWSLLTILVLFWVENGIVGIWNVPRILMARGSMLQMLQDMSEEAAFNATGNARTAAALRDGWLHTGDIGAIDEDGYLFILDRKKDMAIVGGFNVYPREIEEALCAHPAVVEAAVIGVPDSYRGEALIGYVVLRLPGASGCDALTSFLAERLTRYKISRDIRICAALPKTTVGKIDKVALKAAHRG